ncbi:MAG TPA: NAD(P)-binding domain-containing protein, partial [Actinomycetota bacterium]|nr:NAD(P)-binding domain-containing protein [Actinomycetota bacterium]
MVKVAVVGAGKMGLPLAAQFASRGADVTACDRNPAVVEAINVGESPVDEPGVPAMVTAAVARGVLRATTNTAEAAREAEVIVVIVPALLTREPDIDTSLLVSASRDIARGLQLGSLVSYETTLPVGGTRRFLLPALERSGLQAGVDFDLVFSPERVKSQRVLAHLERNAKIVGGITP